MQHQPSILVTGGTGFVGSYLLRYLVERGYTRIRALRRPASNLDLVAPVADRIEWIEGDVLDIFALADALTGVEQVYHCAALVSFLPGDAQRLLQVNVEGTANVVNAALEAGIDKLVHISSVAALGRTRNGETLSEQNFWQRGPHNTNYAISKFLSEQEVWRGMAEGLRVGVVNPSIILGSGRWDEGPLRFFRLAWNNFPFYPQGGSGFVDVRDVARFMIQLMESSIDGQRYILNAENTSYGDLLRQMALLLDRRPPFIPSGRLLHAIAWRFAGIAALFSSRPPFITRETARNATRRYFFDNQKSMADFDFHYTPLAETLAATCRQFREAAEANFPSKHLPLHAF